MKKAKKKGSKKSKKSKEQAIEMLTNVLMKIRPKLIVIKSHFSVKSFNNPEIDIQTFSEYLEDLGIFNKEELKACISYLNDHGKIDLNSIESNIQDRSLQLMNDSVLFTDPENFIGELDIYCNLSRQAGLVFLNRTIFDMNLRCEQVGDLVKAKSHVYFNQDEQITLYMIDCNESEINITTLKPDKTLFHHVQEFGNFLKPVKVTVVFSIVDSEPLLSEVVEEFYHKKYRDEKTIVEDYSRKLNIEEYQFKP